MKIYLKINWNSGYGTTFKINNFFFSFVDKYLFINNKGKEIKCELELNKLKTIYSSRSGLTYEGFFPIQINENKIDEIVEIPFFRTDFHNYELFQSDSHFSLYDRKNEEIKIKKLNEEDFKYDVLVLEYFSDNECILNIAKAAKIDKLYILNIDTLYNNIRPKKLSIISNYFVNVKNEKFVEIGSIFVKVDELMSKRVVSKDSNLYEYLMKNKKIV